MFYFFNVTYLMLYCIVIQDVLHVSENGLGRYAIASHFMFTTINTHKYDHCKCVIKLSRHYGLRNGSVNVSYIAALFITTILLLLSNDVHPNPGPSLVYEDFIKLHTESKVFLKYVHINFQNLF